MSGGELNKRAIRMEEIDDLVVKMLDVEEAKADYVTQSSKWNKENQGSYDMDGLVLIFKKWFERWFGSEESK